MGLLMAVIEACQSFVGKRTVWPGSDDSITCYAEVRPVRIVFQLRSIARRQQRLLKLRFVPDRSYLVRSIATTPMGSCSQLFDEPRLTEQKTVVVASHIEAEVSFHNLVFTAEVCLEGRLEP